MRGRLLRAGVAAVAITLLAGSAGAATTPTKIIDTKANESHPSVADGWAAWSSDTPAKPKALHGYVRPTGGAISRIPVKGHVRIGNIVTDGPHAGQVVLGTDVGGDGSIRFYDLTTTAVSKAPTKVNTAKWERDPSVSGDYLAFVRYAGGAWNLMLYRFSTGDLVRIFSGGAYAPQVNGDYVAFSVCTGSETASCKVAYRYTISTDKVKKMPAPAAGRANYYAAVGSDGTTYWVEGSATKCGAKVKIRRWVSGTLTTAWAAPARIEVAYLQADVLSAMNTLAFSLYTCSTGAFGAYRLSV
jgi:hypothetical protein